jgi:hypothetical protein
MVVNGKIDEIQARVMGDAVLVVEILSDPSPFLAIAESDPNRVGDIERPEPGKFEFRYQGGPEQAANFLAQLIKAEIRVASFAPRKDNLEGLFLKVGAKTLS